MSIGSNSPISRPLASGATPCLKTGVWRSGITANSSHSEVVPLNAIHAPVASEVSFGATKGIYRARTSPSVIRQEKRRAVVAKEARSVAAARSSSTILFNGVQARGGQNKRDEYEGERKR